MLGFSGYRLDQNHSDDDVKGFTASNDKLIIFYRTTAVFPSKPLPNCYHYLTSFYLNYLILPLPSPYLTLPLFFQNLTHLISNTPLANLREVGVPSRNILHGRGVGSKSRIRVTGPGGSLGAFDSQNTYRNFSLESFFLGPRMRDVNRNFVFRGSTS